MWLTACQQTSPRIISWVKSLGSRVYFSENRVTTTKAQKGNASAVKSGIGCQSWISGCGCPMAASIQRCRAKPYGVANVPSPATQLIRT